MKIKLLYLLFMFLGFHACKEKTVEQAEIIKPVRYQAIGQANHIEIKTFSGTAQSGQESNLSFRANGQIIALLVKNGDRVRRGQLLARLDQKDVNLSYDKAKASVASAESQMQTAESSLDRVKQLYQSNGASLNEYEQAKNAYNNAKASYENAVKSLRIQESQFEYTKISAPLNGVITQVNAEVNEFAQAGQTILVMNSEGDDLEIKVGIPENFISQINEGMITKVRINDQDFKGEVTEVAFAVGSSFTYPVVVKIIDPSENLRPGMPAEVQFTFGSQNVETAKNEIIIPINAVANDKQGQFCYKLETERDDQYITKRINLELGELTENGFVVQSGVKSGDLVATAGLRSLYDGMKVKLLN